MQVHTKANTSLDLRATCRYFCLAGAQHRVMLLRTLTGRCAERFKHTHPTNLQCPFRMDGQQKGRTAEDATRAQLCTNSIPQRAALCSALPSTLPQVTRPYLSVREVAVELARTLALALHGTAHTSPPCLRQYCCGHGTPHGVCAAAYDEQTRRMEQVPQSRAAERQVLRGDATLPHPTLGSVAGRGVAHLCASAAQRRNAVPALGRRVRACGARPDPVSYHGLSPQGRLRSIL